jgi:hypothetical protein
MPDVARAQLPGPFRATVRRQSFHYLFSTPASWSAILRRMPNPLEVLVGEMTLAELASKSKRSVDQIVSFAMQDGASASRGRGATASPSAAKAAPKASRGGNVNTRSRAGREAYEQAVFNVLNSSKGKVAAADIRSKVGGTPMQARAALNRLIEDRRVSYEGKARATRYSLA